MVVRELLQVILSLESTTLEIGRVLLPAQSIPLFLLATATKYGGYVHIVLNPRIYS